MSPDAPSNKPKWDAAEIDRYLLLLAREAAPLIPQRWSEFESAARKQGQASAEIGEIWDNALSQGPQSLAATLMSTQYGFFAHLRHMAPFHVLVPVEPREELLRSAVLSGACGPEYSERWKDPPPEGGFVDAISQFLLAEMTGPLRTSFSEFVELTASTKWIISADFCIGDRQCPNDVFCYTVFPYDASFEDICKEVNSIFPRDFKAIKNISEPMVEYLRSRRRFHFAFVVNKDRSIIKDVEEARSVIDTTLAMMKAWHNADDHLDEIAAAKALRQEANAKSFNYRLLGDMILIAAFAATIAVLLDIEGRAELIGFFPDRDKMTMAYQAIGYRMFSNNQSSFAARRRVPEAQTAHALPGPRTDGTKGIYFDELVRIPDFVAGAIAGSHLVIGPLSGVSQKSLDLVAKAFIDSDGIAMFRVDVPPKTLSCSRIVVQSTPPPPAPEGSTP